ncbi:hypothetical protein HanIR_Chr05g0245971 [Helianthus annuus]|nr:hypothetical protein HanIR_Chr05g0245971 [Helianthus annuus]
MNIYLICIFSEVVDIVVFFVVVLVAEFFNDSGGNICEIGGMETVVMEGERWKGYAVYSF